MTLLRAFWRPSPAPEASGSALPEATRTLLRRLEVVSRRELAGALAGEMRTRLRGRGMEFAGIRPYLPGDEVRLIDWNVTARTGTPHLRLYQEERSRTLTLVADLSPSCTPALRALQLRAAALLAFAAVHNRDRLALVAVSDRVEEVVPPGLGRNHALRILHALHTRIPAGQGTDLSPALETALALHKRPGMVILLSDFHCPLPQPLLRRAGARHDLIALVLRDAAEDEPAQRGLLQLRDAESGRERLLDLTTAASREAVASRRSEHDRALGRTLDSLAIDHVVLDSDEELLPILLRLFRRRRGGRNDGGKNSFSREAAKNAKKCKGNDREEGLVKYRTFLSADDTNVRR